MSQPVVSGSIRTRLIMQLLGIAAIMSALLYVSVRSVADTAVRTTQDSILGAAVISIAEELKSGLEGLEVDISYATFSMLGAVNDDRIFYRIAMGGETITGYDALPGPADSPGGLTPVFYSADFRGDAVRVAAVDRSILIGGQATDVLVLVAQTQTSRAVLEAQLAKWAAALGAGFFSLSAILSVLTARSVLRPIDALREAVERRGPRDLRAVQRPVPSELAALVTALNGFIGRLSAALTRTETFIAEAAHHIRTPLATLKAQSETALYGTNDEAARASLRAIIRSADDAARSASQLLDHAAVIYRTDQRADERIDLGHLVNDVVDSMIPTAEIRDITLTFLPKETGISIEADRVLIESAARNLLDNAIKYTPADGKVDVVLQRADRSAQLVIRDTGRGLAGANQSELSRRFQRGRNVSEVVGSGLGLTIVREVAKAHGGTFDLSERPSGGTCATLSLPLG